MVIRQVKAKRIAVSNLSYIYKYCRKGLRIGLISKAGRNNSGIICVAHKRGHSGNYYLIDFYRRAQSFGGVYKIIKDLYRTAYLGGVFYDNGLFSYIVLSEGVYLGSRIFSGTIKPMENNKKNMLLNGDAVALNQIKLFSVINNLELRPFQGSSLARSAGSRVLLTGIVDKDTCSVKLKSGWIKYIKNTSIASIGIAANSSHCYSRVGKAGNSFKLGKRPHVRGVAMNPCDHPHGGGEGKKSPSVAQVSPWGWITKGGTPSKKKLKDKLKKKLYKTVR